MGYLGSSTSLGISDFEISTFAFEHDPGGAIYPNSKGAEIGMLTGIAGKQKLPSLFVANCLHPQIKKGVKSNTKPPFSTGSENLNHFIKPHFL